MQRTWGYLELHQQWDGSYDMRVPSMWEQFAIWVVHQYNRRQIMKECEDALL